MSQRPSVAVITDSTCDLPPEVALSHGITVVPLVIHFENEEFRDQIDLGTDQFMSRMLQASKLPTTSRPPVSTFERVFREAATTHNEILCIVSSAKLTHTYQSAQAAAKNVADVINVELVDSQNTTYALGFQALRAAELATSGENAAKIASILQAELYRYHVMFFVETLDHVRRGGHITKAAQMVGSLLQIRPLLRIEEGQIVPFERTRTRSKAIETLGEFAGSVGVPEEIAVIYNTTPDDAREIADNAAELTPDREVIVARLGPVITTHIGPDVLGLIVKEELGD